MLLTAHFFFAVVAAVGVQGDADSVALAQPLFASYELLDLRFAADLRTLIKDTGKHRGEFEFEGEQEHPATLSYVDGAGNTVVLDIQAKTRGHFRRHPKNCNFPPLRLDFKPTQGSGTLFENQDKLKLVAHCQDKRDQYEQYVLLEYLIYRAYMLLTDRSFRVRLARMTYVDTAGRRDSLTKYGFLIEDEERMAARNGATLIDSSGVRQAETDDEQSTLVALFQYFIGHADWKVSVLHNIKLIQSGFGLPMLVPYDFDFSGAVRARYASPPDGLGIMSVEQRVFISPCRTEYDLNRTFALFNEHKDAIYALYRNQVGLEEENVERTLKYFDEFYEMINDPKKVKREFIRRCPG